MFYTYARLYLAGFDLPGFFDFLLVIADLLVLSYKLLKKMI